MNQKTKGNTTQLHGWGRGGRLSNAPPALCSIPDRLCFSHHPFKLDTSCPCVPRSSSHVTPHVLTPLRLPAGCVVSLNLDFGATAAIFSRSLEASANDSMSACACATIDMPAFSFPTPGGSLWREMRGASAARAHVRVRCAIVRPCGIHPESRSEKVRRKRSRSPSSPMEEMAERILQLDAVVKEPSLVVASHTSGSRASGRTRRVPGEARVRGGLAPWQ